MEDKKSIFFITSYKDSMLNKYIININKKEQNQYLSFPKEINGKKYSIFINEIDIPSELNDYIKILIEIMERKSNKKREINEYILEKEYNQEKCIFLFNYSLTTIKEKFVFELYWHKRIAPWNKPDKFINEDISNNEKFCYFFNYLLSSKEDIDKFNNYYTQLSQSFIKEIEKNKEQDSINIEIVISILISSLYEKKNFSSFYDLKLKEKNIELLNNMNLISSLKEHFLSHIIKIIEILKKKEDKEILEIIIIYFIKFDRENIKIIFGDDFKKKLVFKIFQQEKLIFLSDELLDDNIKEIFISQCQNIESILNLLKTNDNYISYLNTINNNFDKIYKEIASLKSLKGLFNINFKVSQEDDFNELVKLHNNILEKEKAKKKYIINFIPIIDKYFDLYSKNKNLEGLCSLELMIYEENNIFKNINKIKDINKKLIEKIKELLIDKIKAKNIKGKDSIYIISKLKHHFKDETFNIENKKLILSFIIDKCKENDDEMIEEYKINKIWRLFFDDNEKGNDIYLDLLKKQNYNGNDKFVDLFPEEINQKQEKVILDIIKEVINKENDVQDEYKDSYFYFYKIFTKNKKMFPNFMNFFKDKMDNKRNTDIIISYFNKNTKNVDVDKNNIKLFIDFIDDNLLKNDIYFFKYDKEIMIPVYILEKTRNLNHFQELFLKKLSFYIIDEKAIFSENKTNKFLLLEQMIDKDLFLNEYKKKTESFIEKLYENRENEIHKNLIKIYNNKTYKTNYYDKIIKILNKDQKRNINEFLAEIGNNENKIKSLKKIEKFLVMFFPSKIEEILKINSLIDKLNDGPINLKLNEKYSGDLKYFINNYNNNNINDDIKKLDSACFNKIYWEIKDSFKDEKMSLKKTKEKFEKFRNIFDNQSIEEKMEDQTLKVLLQIKDKKKLNKEIKILYIIFKEKESLKIEDLKEITKLVEDILSFESFTTIKKVIYGLKILLENLNFKDEIYENIKKLLENYNKENIKITEITENAKNFLKDINIIPNESIEENKLDDSVIHFFILLNQFPNAIIWIIDKNENDFKSLDKLIIDSDKNELLSLKVINLIDIKRFFKESNIISSKILIDKILDNLKGDKNNNIINYMDNFIYLEKLYNMREENKEKFLDNFNKYIFNINYNNKKQKFELESIEFNEKDILNEYRKLIDIHFFSSNDINGNNFYNEYNKKWKNIIKIYNNIIKYISLLNNRRNELFNNEKIKLKIINDDIISLKENESLLKIIQKLEDEESAEKNILMQDYSSNRIIRFFYGKQFYSLFQFIKAKEYDEIKYFIPYNFNKDIIVYTPNAIIEDKDYNFKEKLNIISDYFNIIFDNNEIKLDNLYLKNNINNNIEYDKKKIYIKSFFKEQYENACINIFVSLTGNLPLLSNLLIYNEDILEEEVLCFLSRVIKCNSKSLFILIFAIEPQINKNKIDYLFNKINEYINKKENESIFLILFSDKNKELIFENIKNYRPFEYNFNENELKEKIKNKFTDNKITIICSDLCGAGKTEYIKNIDKINQNYIYFPLGGYLTRKSLIRRVKNEIKKIIIENKDKENIIHIDLSDSDFENIIKEFLFNFLILNYYGHNEEIFFYNYYGSKIRIKIEIPNTYINYLEKYKILTIFPIEKKIIIKNNIQNDIPIIRNEKTNINCIKDSKIQIISSILNLFENNKIGLKNIDLNSKKYIDQSKCSEIINNCLINQIEELKNKTNYHPNFYQIKNFINYLSSEFLKFTECFHLDPNLIYEKNVPRYFANLRLNIIDSLIKNSIYYTFSPFDSIINEKVVNFSQIQFNEEREKKYEDFFKELENNMKDTINYDDINPSILAFHDNGIRFSIISNDEKDKIFLQINEYFSYFHQEMRNLNTGKKLKILIDLEKDRELLDEILQIISYSDIKEANEAIKKKFQIDDKELLDELEIIKKAVKEKFPNYVFTRDNFVKMVLLIIRIRSGIPTILMGETGCGKTHLLEMFSFIYGKNSDNMYTLKFHSGITDEDINEFIKNTITKNEKKEKEQIDKLVKIFEDDYEKDKEEKKKDYNKEKEKKENMNFFQKLFYTINIPEGYKKYKPEKIKKSIEENIHSRKIIIFFDEINTCNSFGLIKQIMCEKEYRRKYGIPDRFIIICACNPYRFLNEKNEKLQFGLSLRNQKKRKLVYTVNPLPFSLLNFVFDFKDLAEETTKKYIEIMIKKRIGENELLELIEKLLEMSHAFIKEKSDISSVSLREINRFGKMYNFFKKYLEDRKMKLDKNQKIKDSIILSLYFCYYLKIPISSLRIEYLTKIKNIAEEMKEDFDFIGVSKRESDFIATQILDGKIEYSKNKALTENLFCEFICLINKEPLIICGKPGSSKSLSVQLIIDSMSGENSSNKFFCSYKRVVPAFYQCSLISTSENIQEVFEKAKMRLENNNYSINSLILMDELGIADESKNNPLKVLHSELDKNINSNDEDKKISFIGISNWSLDASKMNRAINIVIEEPDIDFIKQTAKDIASSIDKVIAAKSEKLINAISNAYIYYITDYQPKQGKEDFHGLRDFYYLIKYVFNSLSKIYCEKNENFNIDNHLNIILQGIIKNFGGQEKSIDIMKKKFNEYYYFDKNDKIEIPINYNVID